MTPATVAVLAGGLSLERDVSLRSGRRVVEALTDRGHAVTRLDLDDGLVAALADGGYDAAYLALHGKAGEDGGIQAVLELLGMAYTGPDAVASSLAWDKSVAKGLFQRAGVRTPAWMTLSSEAVRDMGAAHALARVAERFGTPLVVKPAQGGAAMGVRQVDGASELAPALMNAFSYHDVALIEEHVAGTEVAVSVIRGEPLPSVEVVPRHGDFDYTARYTHGATEYFAPARLDQGVLDHCAQTALRAWDALGCRDVSRADLIVDADGRPWLLELDTCPGMTETSLLPTAARAAGWAFEDVCERVLEAALERGLAGSDPARVSAPSPSPTD